MELNVFFSVLVGCVSTIQSGLNSQLKSHLGVQLTILVSLLVSLVTATVLLVVAKVEMPDSSIYSKIPMHLWLGGLCGVVFLFGGAALAPKMGAASYTSALIAGQLICALILDHFGLLGFDVQRLNLTKIIPPAKIKAAIAT